MNFFELAGYVFVALLSFAAVSFVQRNSGRPLQLRFFFLLWLLAFTLIGELGSTVTAWATALGHTPTPYPTSTKYVDLHATNVASMAHASVTPWKPLCLGPSQITTSMIGQTICVQGTVARNTQVGESTTQIRFAVNPGGFFLAGGTYWYAVRSGDCVRAKGLIQRSAEGVPYIRQSSLQVPLGHKQKVIADLWS